MYPKCPAQSTNFLWQVSHVEALSETPNRGSRQPNLAGFRLGMVNSSLLEICNSARRCKSSLEKTPNCKCEIFLGGRSNRTSCFVLAAGSSSSSVTIIIGLLTPFVVMVLIRLQLLDIDTSTRPVWDNRIVAFVFCVVQSADPLSLDTQSPTPIQEYYFSLPVKEGNQSSQRGTKQEAIPP